MDKRKGGAEKLRIKRQAELKAAGSNSGQTKIAFVRAPTKDKII